MKNVAKKIFGGGFAIALLVMTPGSVWEGVTNAINGSTFNGWMDNGADGTEEEGVWQDLVQTSLDLTVSTVTGYENFGIVTADKDVYMLNKPSENGEITGLIPVNAGCDVIETEGEWTKIKSGDVEGYVKSEYIAEEEEAVEKARDGNYIKAKSTVNNLRMRKDADLEAGIITKLKKDQETEVLEVDDEWVKVKNGDTEGYVHSDYIEIKEELPEAVKVEIKPDAPETTTSKASKAAVASGTEDLSPGNMSVVQYAMQFVGNPYKYGGTSLTNGADCSGFTQSVYAKFGVSLSRTSSAQAGNGTRINISDIKAGDLVFYNYGSGGISHVAIYIGNGNIVHAANSRSGIKVSPLNHSAPVCAVRVI